jgi:hypothetical protein
MFSLDDLLSDYQGTPVDFGEIQEAPDNFDIFGNDEEGEARPGELEETGELDYNGEPLEFSKEDFDFSDFEDIAPEDLEETEVIKSPTKD